MDVTHGVLLGSHPCYVPQTMLFTLLLGCPNANLPAACESGADPTLTVGTGGAEFAPFEDETELVNGPQGGYHIEIALAATFIDASDVISGEMTATIDGEVVGEGQPWLSMKCNKADEQLYAFGSNLIVFGETDQVDGKEALIEVMVRDLEGIEVTATATTTLHFPE